MIRKLAFNSEISWCVFPFVSRISELRVNRKWVQEEQGGFRVVLLSEWHMSHCFMLNHLIYGFCKRKFEALEK